MSEFFLPRADFEKLFQLLHADGYTILGPTVDQAAIVYSEIRGVADLPAGITDEQSPGVYRLKPRDDQAWFGYTVGPASWKRYLFPPLSTLIEGTRTDAGWTFSAPQPPVEKYAFLGVRACEIAAIAVQDRTFLHGPYVDPIYKERRERSLILAVNCTQAASTCFCESMGTGPRCTGGFDLAMTELPTGFVIESGSAAGEALLARLGVIAAEEEQSHAAGSARENASRQMQRTLDTTNIRDLLLGNLEHSRWAEVAQRCLSCTNCTMVCPTCFCHSVREVTDLSGDHTRRERQWDSCFHVDFSYMNGAPVRNDIRSRYRQWLTHKLASWIDQFGTSGCVGCGRCITWCPVGIDLTEEVAAIRASSDNSTNPSHASAAAASSLS